MLSIDLSLRIDFQQSRNSVIIHAVPERISSTVYAPGIVELPVQQSVYEVLFQRIRDADSLHLHLPQSRGPDDGPLRQTSRELCSLIDATSGMEASKLSAKKMNKNTSNQQEGERNSPCSNVSWHCSLIEVIHFGHGVIS